MDSGTHTQSAALTTGHGTLKKRSDTFKQVTAPTCKSRLSQSEVTAPSKGFSSYNQRMAMPLDSNKMDGGTPGQNRTAARWRYPWAKTGQQETSPKPKLQQMLD
jgi:hypothetical protein